MTLPQFLLSLDKEIEELQATLDPKRPERDLGSFARLRALSLGRTALRMVEEPEKATYVEVNAAYDRARGRIIS